MIDNIFTASPTAWAALVAGMIALPIVIHFINLLRHKKVEWAAMEFLLQSYRKNRNWIRLKQLCLLLCRIAILLLALFMLGQVGCHDNRLSRILGGSTTHHYVLLDDSFSMSEQGSEASAFDRTKSTLSLIASRAKNRQSQLVTLMRFSSGRSGPAASPEPLPDAAASIQQVADLSAVLVDSRFDQRVEEVKSNLAVSNLNVDLTNLLPAVKNMIADRKQENAIVYVLSDFRKKDWQNCRPVAEQMQRIHESGAAIELIRCATTAPPNLAVTTLQPDGNVRVAGTPLMMKVTVKNCSTQRAEKIQLKVRSILLPEIASGSQTDYRATELPTVFIQEIEPGQSETRTFPVFFESKGQHVIVVELPEDAVRMDNRRWCCTVIQTAAEVLIIDDGTSKDSRFLSLALNPNRMTGIQSETRTKDFLRDGDGSELERYDVIFLLGIDSLDESAVKNLESFVRRGGGLVWFCGPEINLSFYNEYLFRGGEGLLPMPLGSKANIPEMIGSTADVSPAPHPIFAPVLNVKNSLLELVQVKKIMAPPAGWNQSDPGQAKVLATVRGNENWPLLVEKGFGKGRVALITTTVGPSWNNWSRNATFPPILLLLENHLAQGKYEPRRQLTGEPIQISVPAADYRPEASFQVQLSDPTAANATSVNMGDLRLGPRAGHPDMLEGTVGRFVVASMAGETDASGIYDITLTRMDGVQERQRYAVNVDTDESDLEDADQQKLTTDLRKSQPSFVDWNAFNPEPSGTPVSTLHRLLLVLLVIILITEQIIGYSASYHRN